MGPPAPRPTTPAMRDVVTVWVRSGAKESQSRTWGTSKRSGPPTAGERRIRAPVRPAVSPAITTPARRPSTASRQTDTSSDSGTTSASDWVLNRTSLAKLPRQLSPEASTTCGGDVPSARR
jgi:hypothetical protein